MMKKKFLAILLTICTALCLFALVGCGEVTVTSISITGESEVCVNDFSLDDYTIKAKMSDDTTKDVTLSQEHLSASDLKLLEKAGEHTVTVTYGGVSTEYTFTLTKDTFENITFANKTVTYNGNAHSLELVGVPDFAEVSFNNANSFTNAGSYPITATVSAENYQDLELSATLTVNKATYDMSRVTFEGTNVVYDGQPHTVTVANLPEGVTAQVENKTCINADTYQLNVAFTGDSANYNPIPNQTATLKIEKRELTISFYGETDLWYTGDVQKTITAQGTNVVAGDTVPVTISYSGNMKDEGTYTATASINHPNYQLTTGNTTTVTIARAIHTVTFKQTGQTDKIIQVAHLADGTSKIPTPIPQTGYDVQWKDCDLSCVTTDLTIYAEITLVPYDIIYVNDGASVENPASYTVESNRIVFNEPTNAMGKTFAGWYTTPDFKYGTEITSIETGTRTGDLTIYAQWLNYRVEQVTGFEIDYSTQIPQIKQTVSNATKYIDFRNILTASKGCTWKLFATYDGLNSEYTEKSMSLQVGTNTAYLTVYHPDGEHVTRYEVNIYRLDMFEVVFMNGLTVWSIGGVDADKDGYLDGTDNNVNGIVEGVEELSVINAPETAPSKTAYNFVGWTVNGQLVEFPYTIPKRPTSLAFGAVYKVVFEAKYAPIDYTVTLNPNGGILTDTTLLYNIETAIYSLPQPTRDYYTFSGWYRSNTFYEESLVTSIALGNYGSFTLYAKWTPITYYISYVVNGGDALEQTPYTVESTTFTLPTATRQGYNFVGWFTESTFENQITEIALGSHGDLVLHAKWTEKVNGVRFEGNGNTSGTMADFEIKSDHTSALPKNGFVRDGYTFIGWATSADGEVVYTDGADYTMGTEESYTLYAKWQANLNTLHFNGNGNTGGETSDMTIHTDESKALTANGFEKTYYHFIGWATTPDGEIVYTDGASYTMGTNAEYTLYAVWAPNEYAIHFEGNGNTDGSMNDFYIPYKNTDTLPANSFIREGYRFLGWATSIDGEVVYNDMSAYTMSSTADTLYAKWEAIVYTITYHLNEAINHGNNPETFTIENLPLVLEDAAVPTGYYSDWYFDEDFTRLCTQINQIGNVEIYAYVFYETDDQGVTYAFYDDRTASVIGCNNLSDTVVVPSTLHNYSITSVAEKAFENCSSLSRATIPDSVVSIGASIFKGCSNLTSLVIPFVGASSNYQTETVHYPFGYIFGQLDYTGAIETSQTFYDTGSLTTKTYYIPATLKEVTIAGGNILYGAFNDCSGLTSVTIGNSVTSIGEEAFYDCSGLTSIVIPDSVTAMGTNAFAYCTALTRVEIGNSVASIEQLTFSYCQQLQTVIIGDKVSTIAKEAFNKCISLENVTLGSGVTQIANYAFMDCTSLKNITVPNNVTSIGNGAFSGCSALKRITLPFVGGSNHTAEDDFQTPFGYIFGQLDYTGAIETSQKFYDTGSLTTKTYYIPATLKEVTIAGGNILYGAFYNCSGLTSVTIGNSVTSIGSYAFYNCSGLTSVTIGNSVTSIGSYAFYYCYGLTSITIPNGVTSIGSYAFKDCSGLTSIVIPNSVTSIGGSAFMNCSGLKRVNYTGTIDQWVMIDFGNYSSNPLYYAKHLYLNDVEVTEVNLTTSTKINAYAFYNCSKLTSVTIPNSVTSIGDYAFYNCSSLTIYAEVSSTPSGWNSSWNYDDRPVVWNYAGTKVTENGIRYALRNDGTMTVYGYEGEATEIEIASAVQGYSVTAITRNAFYGESSLTSIVIPDSVTSIGYKAFYGCSDLTSIVITDSITSIGMYAFSGCSSLTSIEIPDSVTSIGYEAFSGCRGLTEITLPFVGDSIKTASDTYQYPFGYIFGTSSYTGGTGTKQYYFGSSTSSTTNTTYYIPTSLKKVTITGGNILYGAFYNCSSLTSVTIGNSVTSIGNYAFYGCGGLTSVTIGNGVTSIGEGAYNCTALTEIYFNATAMNDLSSSNYVFAYAGKSGTGITVTIGANVTKIPAYLFYPCSSSSYLPKITSVVFEEGSVCKSIGSYAFYDCSKLTSVTIGNSVESIGSYAFYECSGLTGELVIPDSVTSIGYEAFYDCSKLTSVTIGNSVESIGDYAFRGCSGLTEIYFNATEMNDLSSNDDVFSYSEQSGTGITVTIGANVTKIPAYLFYSYSSSLYAPKITSVVFEAGSVCTSIGDYAFAYCSSLTSIVIPDSVTSIGSDAFYDCDGLTSIVIPDSVTSIGSSAFSGCSGLESVTIGNSVTSIGSYAFRGCSGLTSIVIPDSVTSIDSYAFYNCSRLTSVTFENTSGWYVSTSSTATSGKKVTLTNASTNATYFKSTYYNYYWKRS